MTLTPVRERSWKCSQPRTLLSQLYHLDMVLYVRGKAFPNCTTCINTFIVCSSSEPPAEQQQQADLGTALVRVTARQACLQKVVGAAARDEKGECLWCLMIVCALTRGQDPQAAQANVSAACRAST